MKPILSILALAIAVAPGPTLAAGSHGGGHKMALGEPAHHKPTRTIEIIMREDYESDLPFIFEPKELVFEAGETVRLRITNKGDQVHEFVMDTVESNAEHKVLMERFPEMEHDDPNAVRLEPGKQADILWTFGDKPGVFQFACLLPGHFEGGMHGPLIIN